MRDGQELVPLFLIVVALGVGEALRLGDGLLEVVQPALLLRHDNKVPLV